MRRCAVYVAGGSSEAALVSSYMRRLEAVGFTITHDWTTSVLDHQARGVADRELSMADAMRHARADLAGVYTADILWLIAPVTKSEGAWFELGVAVGCSMRTEGIGLKRIISGNTSNIFRTVADELFAMHEEAFAWLVAASGADGGAA